MPKRIILKQSARHSRLDEGFYSDLQFVLHHDSRMPSGDFIKEVYVNGQGQSNAIGEIDLHLKPGMGLSVEDYEGNRVSGLIQQLEVVDNHVIVSLISNS